MIKTAKKLIDATEVRKALDILVAPGQVVELRILNATTQSSPRYPYTASGYFNDTQALAKELTTLRTWTGVYITLQPCKRDLLARAHNRLRSADDMKKDKSTTADTNILKYSLLLIDCDPERPAGISSSDEEHEAALARIREIRHVLRRLGWTEPIEADSGNGGHLVYRVDLPITDATLIQRVLVGLAGMFDSEGLHIDQTVYNPSRISKLYGTLACKGDDTNERPHRMSRILEAPATLNIVSRATLEAMAAPEQPKRTVSSQAQTSFDIEQFIQDHHLDVTGPTPWNGGDKWVFNICPWNSEHTDRSAYILRFPSGAIAAGCHHNGCVSKEWQDLRQKYEPLRTLPTPDPQMQVATPSDNEEKKEKGDSQALTLVKMALAEAELFSTSKGERYARLTINGRVETLIITEKGGAFKRWLIHRYLSETGNIPNATALSSAIGVLEAEAQFGDRPQREVYIRLAYHRGKLYLDLANSKCEVIEISSQGWKIITDAPVEFRRPNGMLPLPRPVHGGNLDELKPFVNISQKDWILYLAWLIGTLHPTGPYPILDLNSERGSAKSTTTKVSRMLIDPSKAPLRREPKDDQTFAIMAYNNYIVAFDNLSHISTRMSDNLCTLATGAGDAYRSLYTNDEEHIFDARRPQVFNGIEELATRGDLIDRCIILNLPEIEKAKRRDERTFWNEFNQAHPRILGALLDAVAMALKNLPHTRLVETPRMADFALWVQAAEPALTTEKGAFLAAYEKNREEGIAAEIEASPIGNALLALMKEKPHYDNLASELLKKLKTLVDEDVTQHKSWPQNARSLSGLLKRLAPSLRSRGIYVLQKRISEGSNITISYVAKSAEECSKNDANSPNNVANDANSPALLHAISESTSDFNPSMTQNVANNGLHSLSCSQEKREDEKEEGIDRNIGENLLHFASLAVCMTTFEGFMNTSHGTNSATLRDHSGGTWCENCVWQHDLMNIGHERNYPFIEVAGKDKQTIKIKPGRDAWLNFCRTMGYESIRRVLQIVEG